MDKATLSVSDVKLLSKFFKVLANPIRLVGLTEILRGTNRLIDIAQVAGKMIKKRKNTKRSRKFRSSDVAEHIKKLYNMGLAGKVGSSPKNLLYVPSNEKLVRTYLRISLKFAEVINLHSQLNELKSTADQLKSAKESIKSDDLTSALSGSIPNLDKLIKEKKNEIKKKTAAVESLFK